MDKASKPFPTLGQRLAAAIISYQLGRPTVDGTLKQYVGGNLDPWWEEKALELYKRGESEDSRESVDVGCISKRSKE
jgi:hypothetical protein